MASWDKEDKEDSEDKGAKGAEGHKARVMLDTNVLIAGSGWPRWQREVLLAGLRGDKQLVVSPYVLDETRRVIAMRFPQRLQRLENFLAQAPMMKKTTLAVELPGWFYFG
jgi:predicted nucleic acid-binding protein